MASTVNNILLIGWSSPFPVILFGTMYCRVLYHCFPGRSRCHSVLHKPLRTKKMFNWCLIEIIWRFPKMGVAISYYSSYIMGVAISYIFLLLVLSLRFFSLQNLTDDTVPGRNAWCKGRPPWYHDPSKVMGKWCGKWISSPREMDQNGGIMECMWKISSIANIYIYIVNNKINKNNN